MATLFQDQVHVSAKDPNNTRWLALSDAGQSQGLAQRIRKLYPHTRCWALYEGTFAENVMALSPLLIELNSNVQQAQLEIDHLDKLCAELPIMGLIQTPLSSAQWLKHLRGLLRLQMDGTDYLWRLADTQMLHATASVLDTEQQTNVFGGCQSWWTVTADGTPQNLACSSASVNADFGKSAPLKLNADQERAMLAATAPYMLASQLRAMETTFKNELTHAEQSRFSMKCVEEAREDFLDEDTELLPWALSKWREERVS